MCNTKLMLTVFKKVIAATKCRRQFEEIMCGLRYHRKIISEKQMFSNRFIRQQLVICVLLSMRLCCAQENCNDDAVIHGKVWQIGDRDECVKVIQKVVGM
jgi:hypothetical protein